MSFPTMEREPDWKVDWVDTKTDAEPVVRKASTATVMMLIMVR